MENKKIRKFDIKNLLIIILILIVFILLIQNSSTNNKGSGKKINKSVIQKINNVKVPTVSPLTSMKTIINNYQTCINNNKCPITSSFRNVASEYIRGGGKLNPITRLNGNFVNPQYHIVTELATIAILEVYNSNGTNKIEYNFLNRKGYWKLNSSNCFNSSTSEITSTVVPICN